MELENQRWEYDVSRLVRAVEHLIGPAEQDDTRNHPGEVGDKRTDEDSGERRRGLLSTRNLIGAVGVVAVAVVLIVVFALPKPHHRPPPPKPHLLSATVSVAAVRSDRLALTLLRDGISSSDLPSDVSAASPQLQTYRTSGIVASINNALTGPGPDLYILYEVFDSAPDASHYYAVSNALADTYTATGPFRASGIGDPTKCESGQEGATATQQAEWDWSCLTLSSKVVSFVVVTNFSDTTQTGVDLSTTLVDDAIRHLASVAGATSRSPMLAPPGSRTPAQLFRLLLSGPPASALLPFGVGTPDVRELSATDAPTGLLDGSFASLTFHTSDYADYLSFYVFASGQDARSWFSTNLRPSGSTVGVSIDSSGFSQTTHCGTYSKTLPSTSVVIAACYVLWGHTIVASESWRVPTASTPLVDNENLAVTLARTGVTDLISLDES